LPAWAVVASLEGPDVTRFRAAAGTALVAVLIAACSSSPSPTEEPTPTATPTVEPSEDAGIQPSFEPGAGSLDSVLPDEVGGITIEYQFAEGQAILGSEGITPEVQDFLDRVGSNMDDVSSAIGVGVDQASGGFLSIFAIRVAGADSGALSDEMQQTMEQDSDSVFTEANVGGKDVLAFGTAGQTPDGFMYVHADIVFLVGASTPELSEEALSLLP
jgi:hypothetical protein